MPYRDHDNERDAGYHVPLVWRVHARGYGGAVGYPKRHRQGWVRWCYEKPYWGPIVGLSKLKRTMRNNDPRNSLDGPRATHVHSAIMARARPMYWHFFKRSPASKIRYPIYGIKRSEHTIERINEMAFETRTVSINLHQFAWEQIDDLLANSLGPAMPEDPNQRTVQWLVTELLAAWADGWRRPGSWERQMLEMSGHA